MVGMSAVMFMQSLLRLACTLTLIGVVAHTPCMGQHGATETAQPEFPKGWRFPIELSQGFVGEGAVYAGSVGFGADYAILPGHLRFGAMAGPAFVNGSFKGLGGLRLAWRVKTFNTALGSWGNLHLNAEHLWLTGGPALLGGGATVEAGALVLLGLNGNWSYTAESGQHPGYFQFCLGLNILKGKSKSTNDDPFSNP